MTARELVTDLNRRGFRVSVSAGGIALDGPPDTITDGDREWIRKLKPALLDLLARAVTVHAPALGCEVLCVETLDDIPDGTAFPVYTRAELDRMRGLYPAELHDVHALKESFGGDYEGRADNPNPPACAEGDRVRGYDGERWKVGTVLTILPDDGWTAPDAIGLVMVQLDHTEHQTVFRRERLWPIESEEPPRPSP